MAEGLSPKDVQDLQQIRRMLPAGDPRIQKIDFLLSSYKPEGPSDTQRLMEAVEGYSPVTSAAVKAGRGFLRGAKELAGMGKEFLIDRPARALDTSLPLTERFRAATTVANLPAEISRSALEAQAGQAKEAGAQAAEGMYPRAAFHAVAAGVPLGGPLAAQTLEDVESPELGRFGAAGRLGAYALAPKVVKAPARLRPALTIAEPLGGRVLNSIIKPHLNDFKFGKNPGLAVAREGLTANTAEGLLTKISQRSEQVGAQIDATIAKRGVGKTVNVAEIIDKTVEAERQQARQGGNAPLAEQVDKFRATLSEEWAAKTPDKMTIADATALKRALGKNTRWSSDATAMQLNQVRQRLYGRIREAIDNQVPELKPLNERYGNLIAAEKSLDRAIKTAARTDVIGLKDIVFGTGGGVLGGPVGAIAGFALKRALGTTAVKSRAGAIAARLGRKSLRPGQRPKTLAPAIGTAAAVQTTREKRE